MTRDSTRAAASTRRRPISLGMTPSRYKAGGAQEELRFAIGQSSLGAILVAASERGVAAILIGDDPNTLDRGPTGPVPEGAA